MFLPFSYHVFTAQSFHDHTCRDVYMQIFDIAKLYLCREYACIYIYCMHIPKIKLLVNYIQSKLKVTNNGTTLYWQCAAFSTPVHEHCYKLSRIAKKMYNQWQTISTWNAPCSYNTDTHTTTLICLPINWHVVACAQAVAA